jgi:hypothetical protein
MARVFLVMVLAMGLVAVPAIPVSPASAATGWTSHLCGPSGSTCSFPQTLGSQVTLNAVSCPTTGFCVAVGDYVDSGAAGQPPCPASTYSGGQPGVGDITCSLPLVETLSNGVWKASTLPYPESSNYSSGIGLEQAWGYLTGSLTGVSCTSSTFCVAIGDETPLISPNGVDRYAFTEVLSGGVWTSAKKPFPYPDCENSANPYCDGTGGTVVTTNAIACSTTTSCVAVGDDELRPTTSTAAKIDYQGVAYSISPSPKSGAWTGTGSVVTAPPQYEVTLSGVSCPSSTACVAVGSTTVQKGSGSTLTYITRPLAENLSSSGSTWAGTSISPADPPVASAASLSGVSCQSTTSCEAVGNYTGAASSGSRTGALVESLSGTTWTPTTDLETHADGASGATLAGISCPAATACSAVGQYTDASNQEHALIETLSGGGWVATTGVDPAGGSSPVFSGVSCPVVGTCAAVGNTGTTAGDLAPFVATEASPVATTLLVNVPGTVTSGQPFTITVFAESCVGTVCTLATGFHDTIAFTSSDTSSSLPPDSHLTNGGGTFTVTLDNVGKPPTMATITATDTVNPAITGTSRSIRINGPTAAKAPPSAPQFLHAAGGANGVTLTWYRPADNGLSKITGYLIRRGVTPGGEGAVPIGETSSTTYFDIPAVAGVRYYYVVEAYNAVGVSAPSNEAAAFVTGSMAGARRFASDPSGRGYWMSSANGYVFAFGNAGYYGSPGSSASSPIVSMASTPDGRGYWVAAANGAVFAYGDARYFGSLGNAHLNQPIVGMAATRNGGGYWLVGQDGGVFAFGDARYYGSLGNAHSSQAIVGMAATPNGTGYWLVASNGAVFTFGDAGYYGSAANVHLIEPIAGMAVTPDGKGYWLCGVDGGIFGYGDAHFYGGFANQLIMWPIAGMIASPNGTSYEIVDWVGNATEFGN